MCRTTSASIESCMEGSINIGQAKRRWRVAYAAVFSVRVLASLVKENVPRKGNEVLDSPSHTVIDVEPDHSFSQMNKKRLAKLVKEKSLDDLLHFEGFEGLIRALETNATDGIKGDQVDILRRQEAFGYNTYQKPHKKRMFDYMVEALNDSLIILLLVSAVLSIAFGIKKLGLRNGWCEGGSISFAALLVIIVSSTSKYLPDRQFEKLSEICSKTQVAVIRNGEVQQISSCDVVAGDVICLKAGDKVPADGLILDGHLLQVDESSVTGESEHVKVDHNLNPFLLSGTYVVNEYGQMLVTSVGISTKWGEMTNAASHSFYEPTPLQAKLNKLNLTIGKVVLVLPSFVLVVLLVRLFSWNAKDKNGDSSFSFSKTKTILDFWEDLVGILATTIIIAAAAVPEGLPLAFVVTLAHSTKKMKDDRSLLRKLSACEAMAKATTITINKISVLTLNQMEVIKFWFGGKSLQKGVSSLITPKVADLIHQGVGLSTNPPPSETCPQFSKTPATKAIISWALQEMSIDCEKLKENCTILHVEASNSETWPSRIMIRKKSDGTIHVHRNGTPEKILAMCSHYYGSTGDVKAINNGTRRTFEQTIQDMANKGLHCIAFAHKQMTEDSYDDDSSILNNEDGLILLGIIGLSNLCRHGARRSINECQRAGLNIKLITEEDVSAARAIATECGILKPNQDSNGEVIEGEEFRNYTPEERLDKINRICVIARASPLDKFLAVQCLKQGGHTVAVIGDGTGDIQALREADIGICMGLQVTDVAKESSGIIILDDDFASVVNVLRWGRAIYNHLQTFIQFYLTPTIASLVIEFVESVSARKPPNTDIVTAISAGKLPKGALQLLWVKLIGGTLAALTLTMGQPTQELMERPPLDQKELLITNITRRNILIQAIFQICVFLILHFNGEAISYKKQEEKGTLMFNIFVFSQVFNIRVPTNITIFHGFGIIGVIIIQFVMVEFLYKFADTARLNWNLWLVSIATAFISLPLGALAELIPVPRKPFLSFLEWNG